jgi:hypothetical protein
MPNYFFFLFVISSSEQEDHNLFNLTEWREECRDSPIGFLLAHLKT